MAECLSPLRALFKPTIEYFSCGHARQFDECALAEKIRDLQNHDNQIESDQCMQIHEIKSRREHHEWTMALMPTEAYNIFTDKYCRQSCTLPDRFVMGDNGNLVKQRDCAQQPCMEDLLSLQQRYAAYTTHLTEIGHRLSAVDPQCLSALPGLDVPFHAARLARLFVLFPGCFNGDSRFNNLALQFTDMNALMGRLFSDPEASQLPPFAMQVTCGLALQQLRVLEDEVRWLSRYTSAIEQFEVVLWEDYYIDYDVDVTDDEMELARQTKAAHFFEQMPLIDDDAVRAGHAFAVQRQNQFDSDDDSDFDDHMTPLARSYQNAECEDKQAVDEMKVWTWDKSEKRLYHEVPGSPVSPCSDGDLGRLPTLTQLKDAKIEVFCNHGRYGLTDEDFLDPDERKVSVTAPPAKRARYHY